MTRSNNQYVVLGKIGATYGVRGWLKVYPHEESLQSIFHYSPWFVSRDERTWQAIEVAENRLHGSALVVKFKGIDTKEAAASLTNQKIAVPRANLPPLKKDEYYWSDLIGLTVVTLSGEVLGKVIHLLATGSNDVLIVENEAHQKQAIPYLPDQVIRQIDLEKRQIIVDWEIL